MKAIAWAAAACVALAWGHSEARQLHYPSTNSPALTFEAPDTWQSVFHTDGSLVMRCSDRSVIPTAEIVNPEGMPIGDIIERRARQTGVRGLSLERSTLAGVDGALRFTGRTYAEPVILINISRALIDDTHAVFVTRYPTNPSMTCSAEANAVELSAELAR